MPASALFLAAVGFEVHCVIWGYILTHAESGTLNITFHFQQAGEVGKREVSGRKRKSNCYQIQHL